ncbi:glycosyltransferase family 33 protein [Cylindrobasidium torrendii FP15055 ss-10]|uniref:Chitobiosyldiphosphodolichol beta-mannosyltransferase n=1 Tax=Cylindrobasidium torrendii FP15055 ss-10 TaxID=1314674 RepID=A0A0D7AX48_9AGAR|nr:glycosyltransferase family 33 protein [Cylindrobasidium torrendii FP15055 ss-10]
MEPPSVSSLLLGFGLAYIVWRIITLYLFLRPRNDYTIRSVAILVLGDIGRSPRMMYHAQSFAENGFETNIVGFRGSKPIAALERLPLVQLRYLPDVPPILSVLPFILFGPLKALYQALSILRILLIQIPTPPEFILVQNPPSIPSLVIVALVGKIRGCKVIIDWHNLGYSILALKLGQDHVLVRIAKWIEYTFGRRAYAHLFVTEAMHKFLVHEWNLEGETVVLHDRPPRHFHHCTPQEVHDLSVRLNATIWQKMPSLQGWLPSWSIPYSTPLTDTQDGDHLSNPSALSALSPTSGIPGKPDFIQPASPRPFDSTPFTQTPYPHLRPDRPAVVISSTSWTPDEDFGVLKDALISYEERALNPESRLPKLLMVVTGKGPMRDAYMKEVGVLEKKWKFVRCVSAWLEPEDYPLMLGSCDLGVSLHSSSSALDLPMKVVDMFGCGLPVCALAFNCLDELVKDGVNGLIFNDADELVDQLDDLLSGFPESDRLKELRRNIVVKEEHTNPNTHAPHNNGDWKWEWSSWDENWSRNIRPLVFRDVRH